MPRMTPSQVLDMHTDLVTRMDDARFTAVIEASFSADLDATAADQRRDQVEAQRVEANARYLQGRHYAHVRAAETYHVTEDMCDLVVQIAEQIDATDTWQHRLAPSASGIARFDHPIPVHDIRGRTMKAHWLVWGPAAAHSVSLPDRETPVTMLTWYNDAHDPDEVALSHLDDSSVAAWAQRIAGRWYWIGAEYLQDDAPLGDVMIPVPEGARDEVIADGDTPAEMMTHLPKYAYALWLLLGQTVAAATPTIPERAAGRRAVKKGLPPRVTVISLRRREHRPGEGESVVEWQHRWIVRQHLRWQPYGPRVCPDGPAGHHAYGPVEAEPGILVRRCRHCDDGVLRRITIDPYVKGPEGKPLVQSRKVYDLNR